MPSGSLSYTAAMIRDAADRDAEALALLYNHYVVSTVTTFETMPVEASEMAHRVETVQNQQLPWLVIERSGVVCGYACAVRWKNRAAYSRSVESTIYLHKDYTGQGLGVTLYQALLERLQARGVHTVLGGIALPNAASVGLHEKMGFCQVAQLKEVGRKFDRWIDVGYWQTVLAAAED